MADKNFYFNLLLLNHFEEKLSAETICNNTRILLQHYCVNLNRVTGLLYQYYNLQLRTISKAILSPLKTSWHTSKCCE